MTQDNAPADEKALAEISQIELLDPHNTPPQLHSDEGCFRVRCVRGSESEDAARAKAVKACNALTRELQRLFNATAISVAGRNGSDGRFVTLINPLPGAAQKVNDYFQMLVAENTARRNQSSRDREVS